MCSSKYIYEYINHIALIKHSELENCVTHLNTFFLLSRLNTGLVLKTSKLAKIKLVVYRSRWFEVVRKQF